jgi:hypothetical protein
MWRKSSYSAGNGACVEVSQMAKASYSHQNGGCVEAGPCACGGNILVRDTKLGEDSPVLAFTGAEWDAFIAGAKDGEFDRRA